MDNNYPLSIIHYPLKRTPQYKSRFSLKMSKNRLLYFDKIGRGFEIQQTKIEKTTPSVFELKIKN
jgi:hypothetical protein